MEKQCLLCHNAFESKVEPFTADILRVLKTSFDNLNAEVAAELSHHKEDGNCPFCYVCYEFGHQVVDMLEQIKEMQKEMNDFVEKFVSFALNLRKSGHKAVSSAEAIQSPRPRSTNRWQSEDSSNSGLLTDNSNDVEVLTVPPIVVTENEQDSNIEIKYETRRAAVPIQTAPNASTSNQLLVCEVCRAKFTNNYDLQVHLSLHVGSVHIFSCDLCGDGFFDIDALKKHQLQHGTMELHNCDKCSATFFRHSNLVKHREKHENEVANVNVASNVVSSFNCQSCGSVFADKETLEAHTCKKTYDCGMCTQTFRSKIGLQHHEDTLHARHHKCVNCGMRFRSGKEYKEHRMSHIKEPNVCLICNKTFPSRNVLREHFANTHT